MKMPFQPRKRSSIASRGGLLQSIIRNKKVWRLLKCIIFALGFAIVPGQLVLRHFRMEYQATLEKTQKLIEENDVIMFSKTWCPYCTSSKKILTDHGLKYTVIELDEIKNGWIMQEALFDIARQDSVPNIYIMGIHIGGNSNLETAAKSGRLERFVERLAEKNSKMIDKNNGS